MSDSAAPLPGLPARPPARRRGGLVAVVATVVVVVLIAGGGVVAWRFLGGSGPRPAEVLPASTFAVVSLDLDPSGGQKLAAITTLRKLPSFRDHTGITADTDLVKALYEGTVGHDCPSVDYARDVKPWIGQRAALAGVTLADTSSAPAFVLQVGDRGAATAGLTKLQACESARRSNFGFTVTGAYAVLSDTAEHARAIAAAGAAAPLAQDPTYRKWTAEAGGAGIVNAYAAPSSVAALQKLFAARLGALRVPGAANPATGLTQALRGFRGSAAVLRFHDSGLELSFAGGNATPPGKQLSVADHVGALPADTAGVLAAAVDTSSLTRAVRTGAGATGGLDLARTFQKVTGLRFPGDLATLLGSSFSVSLGGQAPARLSAVKSPADLPLGVLVHGDQARIKALVGRVASRTHTRLADLPATMASGNGKVALASSRAYADELLKQGSLGSSRTFTDAVPHPQSPFVLYLSLQGNGWGPALADEARRSGGKDGAEVASDLQALRALGFSVWNADGDSHGLLRVTVK